MNFAVLDLGTNTFHLLIAERSGAKFQILYKINRPIKLGEDITKANEIVPSAFERALQCLQEFKADLDTYGVEQVRAIATSAVRSATNGQAFIDTVKARTGIEIEVISGIEEADFIYRGVKWSGAIAEKSLIIDIGGGSTEFILCDEYQIFWKKSFDIGASRLLQKFFNSDPLSLTDQTAIENHLSDQLEDLAEQIAIYQPKVLIGSAGTFETYAEMLDPTFDGSKPSATIDLSAYRKLAKTLTQSTHADRTKMHGLIALRVDMIVMATVQTNFVLNLGDFEKMMVSTYDLKMGVLASF